MSGGKEERRREGGEGANSVRGGTGGVSKEQAQAQGREQAQTQGGEQAQAQGGSAVQFERFQRERAACSPVQVGLTWKSASNGAQM